MPDYKQKYLSYTFQFTMHSSINFPDPLLIITIIFGHFKKTMLFHYDGKIAVFYDFYFSSHEVYQFYSELGLMMYPYVLGKSKIRTFSICLLCVWCLVFGVHSPFSAARVLVPGVRLRMSGRFFSS